MQVSNYAKPGHRCRHNEVYWMGLPYYAFGVGASSYLEGRRFSRPAKLKEYFLWAKDIPFTADKYANEMTEQVCHLCSAHKINLTWSDCESCRKIPF